MSSWVRVDLAHKGNKEQPFQQSTAPAHGSAQGFHKKFSGVAGLGMLLLKRCQMQSKQIPLAWPEALCCSLDHALLSPSL